RKVVAGDPGHGRVPKAHRADRRGHPARLVAVQRLRPAGVDLAEVTPARALVAADEERGLPVLPALVDVGAAGLLADGVQALAPDQALELGVFRTHPRPRLDPRRLALDRRLRVAHLEPEQPAAVWLYRGHASSLRGA